MNSLNIAFRNVRRNARRSIMTLLALAVGTMAILLFAGYVTDNIHGLQTATVRSTGHLQIVSKGFLEFGRANPDRFAIRDYDVLIDKLRNDDQLKDLIHIITPILNVEGVAGNFDTNSSTSFSGEGVVPAERAIQLSWDGFGMRIPPVSVALDESRPEAGVIGHGMAQLLGLCEKMGVNDCRSLDDQISKNASAESSSLPDDISGLVQELTENIVTSNKPSIDLLASSTSGNPNVVRMELVEVQRQAIREVDSMFVAMPLGLAQRLVFGLQDKGASAIILQVHKTSQMAIAKSRIQEIIKNDGLKLEVLTFNQISSVYDQIVQNYDMIFQFIATLIAMITIFSIANAINMAVGERTAEIGTLRALGFQRSAIRRIFLAEGVVLGLLGTVLGAVLAIGFAEGWINIGGYGWTPPGRSTPIPIRVDMFSNAILLPATIFGLSAMAVISSILPSARAARLEITEALRHV